MKHATEARGRCGSAAQDRDCDNNSADKKLRRKEKQVASMANNDAVSDANNTGDIIGNGYLK